MDQPLWCEYRVLMLHANAKRDDPGSRLEATEIEAVRPARWSCYDRRRGHCACRERAVTERVHKPEKNWNCSTSGVKLLSADSAARQPE